MKQIPERDWKKIRSMKDELLDTACLRILEKIKRLIENESKNGNNHKAFLELWRTLQGEDDKIAEMFNDLKRSNAFFKIAFMVKYNLMTTGKLNEFSDETRELILQMTQHSR